MKCLYFLIFCFLLSDKIPSVWSNLDDFKEDDDDDDFHKSIEPDFDHNVIAGTRQRAEEFKALEPEDAKKRLTLLIKHIDLNKDGSVSKEELKNWILQSLHNLDLEEARSQVALNDENSDGSVSFEEFMHKSYGYTQEEFNKLVKEQDDITKAFIRTIEEDKEKFDMADMNNDGKLNETEYAAFMHPGHYQHMTDYEVKMHIRHFDKNGDGFISFKEFIGDNPKPHELELEKTHFEALDKNKDGQLDQREVSHWAAPGFEQNAQQEVEHLFKMSDKNKDDLLSQDEILDDYEVFVSSQATDYGEHLRKIKDEL